MSYHYGSDSPEIENPFKQEGFFYILSGLIVFTIGIMSLIRLQGQIIDTGLTAGWLSLSISIVLIGSGLTFLFNGFNKRSRFYVGRGAPTSLVENEARGESHTTESNVYYNANEIEQMLLGRKNPTFSEPVNLFERMIYSFIPKLMFLPYTMRNYIQIIIRNTSYSIIGLLVYFLALLSGTVGLTMLTESTFSQWLGIALGVFLIMIWAGNTLRVKRVTQKTLTSAKNSNIAWIIALSVLVPAGSELILRQGIDIPPAPFNPAFALIFLYVLIVLTGVIGITLAVHRTKVVDATTRVSEHRDHWQENVHPKDFFRALDLELANLRYKEIPNRVYQALNPTLNMEGSMDKGSFTGDTIQETQPIFKDLSYPNFLKKLRFYSAIAGHIFIVIAALLLLFNGKPSELSVEAFFTVLFYPLMLALFGTMLLTMAHIYWGEIQFHSNLIQFQGEGTYTESTFSIGDAITDSTKSENTLVRTSFSPWVIMTQISSSTHAKSGANALSKSRYVLSMEKTDRELEQLIHNIKSFLDEKELVAMTRSSKDAQNLEALYALNEASATKIHLERPDENKHLTDKSQHAE